MRSLQMCRFVTVCKVTILQRVLTAHVCTFFVCNDPSRLKTVQIVRELCLRELCRTRLTEICRVFHFEDMQGRRSAEHRIPDDLRGWRSLMIYAFGSPQVCRKIRIYNLKLSADMRKQDLCRSLVVQVCKGLFGEALVFSSPAGPLGSAYRDLCISTHLQNHCGPHPLINADDTLHGIAHESSGIASVVQRH